MSDSVTGRFDNTGFGEGEFGHYFAFGNNEANLEEIIEEWDNDAVVIREDELPHQILETLIDALNDFDRDLEDVHDTRFIEFATDSHLEKIGEQVGVQRQNNETDEEFRVRVESGYARAVSDSTFETFGRVVLNVFNADKDQVSISGAVDEPVVVINAPAQVIDDSPLTADQIAEELTESVPASDGVRVEGTGTFELGGPEYTPSSNSGLNEGTLGYVTTA